MHFSPLPVTSYPLPVTPRQRGGILIMTLVFVSMFLVIFIGLSGVVNRSYHEAVLQSYDELAFQVAEAGLNYGRWRLAHDPDNFDAETKEISDQFAGVLGSYNLTFTPPSGGATIISMTATGTTASQPARQVIVKARYGKPSLASYAYITNSDVTYAAEIHGPVHANGGIRMDGLSDSLMTSAKATYQCQAIQGCNPTQSKPGIWGTGEERELWEFPVAPIDYNALTTDLVLLKTKAQEIGHYYGSSGSFGYELVFNANNTYSLYRVTQKRPNIHSCDYDANNNYGCGDFSHDIQTRVHITTKAVPSGGVIFTEDTLWLSGSIRDRITVAAGRFPDNPATNVDIIINGSLTYSGVRDGTRVLGAIGQRHVLIPYYGAPSVLTMDGAYIAQKGKFGRRYYNSGAHRYKASIDIFGMIASNLVPGTTWTSGGTVVSGYQQKVQTYDSNLLYGAPPYFPVTSDYEFISWEQVQ